MSNYDISENMLRHWEPLFSTEDLENDPALKLDSEEKGKETSEDSFFHEIDKMPYLLNDSVDTSALKDINKSSVTPTPKRSGNKKVYRDPENGFSPSESNKPTELFNKAPKDAGLEPNQSILLTTVDKAIEQLLRRSSRASTQKKTKETDERLKLKTTRPSVAVPKTHDTMPYYFSPEFQSLMVDSVKSTYLSAQGSFEMDESLHPLLTTSLIATPSTVTSHSLVPYEFVPGLDEWNHLYLSRPRATSVQFAIWEWLDSVRSTAFRYPVSQVKHEKSRLDSWTKTATNSSTRDMSMSLPDVYFEDVDEGMASFLDTLLKEENEELFVEVGGKNSDFLAGLKSGFSPVALDTIKTKYAIFRDGEKENSKKGFTPTEWKGSDKVASREKSVSFQPPILSPQSDNKAKMRYRATPHFKAGQPTPNKNHSYYSHASSYPGTPDSHRNLKTPSAKAHYPTTPYGCDSPSTEIPGFWVEFFLNRPDPFHNSTAEVLSWLGEISSIIESSQLVKVPPSAVSSMPSISSLNDTAMTSKLDMTTMTPMCSPMSASFTSPSPCNKSKVE